MVVDSQLSHRVFVSSCGYWKITSRGEDINGKEASLRAKVLPRYEQKIFSLSQFVCSAVYKFSKAFESLPYFISTPHDIHCFTLLCKLELW